MNMSKALLAAAMAASLVGCASITNDSTHPVKLETKTQSGEILAGAECTMTNDYGTFTGKSGTTSPVRRSSKDLDINCKLAGQPDANARAISRANGGMFGNILFGGGIGAIIDHNKGTAYTYPTWMQLIFGKSLGFDRNSEKEGTPAVSTENVATAAK
jgi:hypothetical protein